MANDRGDVRQNRKEKEHARVESSLSDGSNLR